MEVPLEGEREETGLGKEGTGVIWMGGDENLPRGEQSRWLEMGKSGYVIDAGLQGLLKDWMAGGRNREMDRGGERIQRGREGAEGRKTGL